MPGKPAFGASSRSSHSSSPDLAREDPARPHPHPSGAFALRPPRWRSALIELLTSGSLAQSPCPAMRSSALIRCSRARTRGTWLHSDGSKARGCSTFRPVPDRPADPRDSEYVCGGESGRADRQSGTQRWLFSSMRSRLRGTPSRGRFLRPGIAPAHTRHSRHQNRPRDTFSSGRCRGRSGSRMACRAHSRSRRPANVHKTARDSRHLRGDAEGTFRCRPVEVGLRLVISGDDPLADRTFQPRRLKAESQLFEHAHGVETEAAGGVVGAFEVRVLFSLGLSPHEAAEPGAVCRDPVVVHHMIVPRVAIGKGIALAAGAAPVPVL